ncbi:Spy/CpxP family protein refolding chaperone [Pseudorhodoferax sp.]|uniref:Spy/CpxP family protein refolding chaperone n=1 Tax=Pseudorhodoferax sp. TaxID=1993553 RepID=UPI002DD639B9|nr:Spy/CpxP family protein refolding chaperone [Pseudorhodoferax sp.]
MTRSLLSLRRFVLAGSLAGLAAAAMAQTPPAPPPAADAPARHAREHARPDPAQRQAQREARLKQELKITAAQEPAWNVFTASMLPPAPKADRPDRDALRKMTTPQRIERMRAMHAERSAEMERRAEATLRLYAALTPEQQQVFDQRMAMGPRHGPHHRGAPQRHEG